MKRALGTRPITLKEATDNARNAWMCGEPQKHMSAREASQSLSDLLLKRVAVCISPITLELFIRSEWSKIKLYAHRIHEDE